MTTTQKASLSITGLDCVDCAAKLQQSVSKLKGVRAASLSYATSMLEIEFEEQKTNLASIAARVRDTGYGVAPAAQRTFELEGLDCADCAAKLQTAILGLPGVLDADVSFAASRLHVSAVSSDGLEHRVANMAGALGYQARPASEPGSQPSPVATNWKAYLYERRRTVSTAASGLLLLTSFVLRTLGAAPAVTITLFVLATLSGGYYIARSGWTVLRTTRSLDMNALMSIAAIGAMAIGEWDEGATAMFLFSFGNTLEAMTMDRARQAIRRLMELAPQEATLLTGGQAQRVPTQRLVVGDLIEVKPGERAPMDGTVERGQSTLNQAPITGESVPVDASPGTAVYAGSINGHGGLVVRVTKLARDNTLARIVQMVQEAQSRRAPSQRFVDQFARYYTPAVIVLATVVALLPPLLFRASFSTWFYRALVLLVISCPCALVISTPVAIVSAISNAAARGVLIKGGAHLETVGRVRVVAFDKTGTLTEGRASVTDVVPLDDAAPDLSAGGGTSSHPARHAADTLLALAASIEAHSEHPIARAVLQEARHRELPLVATEDYREHPGHGAQARLNGHTYYVGSHSLFSERVPHAAQVCAQVERLESEGKTVVLVGNETEVYGAIAIADSVRATSASTVRELQRMGISEIVLLSGDNSRTAQAIGRQAAISRIEANLMPEDKVTAVERLLSAHGAVAMVGDGVNDAPALARASVGIAMGAAGSDAALETADIILMSDDLARIPYVVRLGRRTVQRIRENIALSLLIKGAFLLLALAGVATLWMAVFADMGTSLIVTFNGMRLLRQE